MFTEEECLTQLLRSCYRNTVLSSKQCFQLKVLERNATAHQGGLVRLWQFNIIKYYILNNTKALKEILWLN